MRKNKRIQPHAGQRKLTDFFQRANKTGDNKEAVKQEIMDIGEMIGNSRSEGEDVILASPEPVRRFTPKSESKKRLPLTVLMSSPKRPFSSTSSSDEDQLVVTGKLNTKLSQDSPPKVSNGLRYSTVDTKENIGLPHDPPILPTSPKKFKQNSVPNYSNWIAELHERFGRHIVEDVTRLTDPHRVVLKIQSKADEHNFRTCILKGFWCNTVVEVGCVVHVLAQFEGQVAVVDNSQGLLIVDPDTLVAGTSVVSTVFCMRKSVFNERFKGLDPGNLAMVVGKLLHVVFQEVACKNIKTRIEILEVVRRMKNVDHLHDLYGLDDDFSSERINSEVTPYLDSLEKWVKTYLGSSGPVASIRGEFGHVKVAEVEDIEENIWSPRYGLKGKVDLSVEVEIQRRGFAVERKVVPMELKTGRDSFSPEHVGQTMLYTMMMAEKRKKRQPNEGLLLYIKNGSMRIVPDSNAEKRGLVQMRNELALHLRRKLVGIVGKGTVDLAPMPDPIRSQFCGRCPHLVSCSIFNGHVDERNLPDEHPLSTLSTAALAHLSREHVEYFLKWCRNIFLEEMHEEEKSDKYIWCLSSWEREMAGDCFAGMVLAADRIDENLHTFARKDVFRHMKSLTEVGLVVGDTVVISEDEGDDIAVTIGSIKSITDDAVRVSCDRDLSKRSGVFRLDRYAQQYSSATNLTNLARLMANQPGSARVRGIVIDRRPPAFEVTAEGIPREFLEPLNEVQRKAVLRAVGSKDYLLIKGFPGAGKTATIVALIRVLNFLGQSVLLSSHTNAAVDNVLLKLLHEGVTNFLRVGHKTKVDGQIIPYTVHHLTKDFKTVEELRTFYASRMIVGVTCCGVKHVMFTKRTFDVCIIDEATQVPQPTSLGPLFCSKRFVLVGDPKQLGPIVRNVEAREAGMEETVFLRLDGPNASVELNIQYRMNGEIAKLANALTYGGVLKCATKDLEESTVSLPKSFLVLPSLVSEEKSWLRAALSTELSNAVVFLDTDCIPGHETKNSLGQVSNDCEADLVMGLLTLFIECGCPASSVGVITPYRKQVELLRHLMKVRRVCGVDASTVDQFQGRDKEVIILSCVRTGVHHTSGEIMHDTRRLNVSLTRAKRKLLLVGSKTALQCYGPFKIVLDSLREDQVFSLGPRARAHCREEANRVKPGFVEN